MSKPIRVLVVEDSLFMQQVIQKSLTRAPDVEVVGMARTGAEALTMARGRKPDVATLDILLPDTDGLDLLGKFTDMGVPCLILSNISLPDSAIAMQALDMGAVDCVGKPRKADINGPFAAELIAKIRVASEVGAAKVKAAVSAPKPSPRLRVAKTAVVIGASAGGPLLIREIIPRLPPDLAAGVLVVQHMSGQFGRQYAQHLASQCKIRVKEAAPGDALVEGMVLVAGGDETVKLEWVGDGVGAVAFSQLGTTHFGFRVWIDAAMATTALIYGRRTVGVLLSGMGNDGVEGLRVIRRAGGRTIAQDESTSVVFGMPKAAIEAGLVDHVLPAQKIADAIVEEVKLIAREAKTA